VINERGREVRVNESLLMPLHLPVLLRIDDWSASHNFLRFINIDMQQR
jgi:extradiol dioxygenase family protein